MGWSCQLSFKPMCNFTRRLSQVLKVMSYASHKAGTFRSFYNELALYLSILVQIWLNKMQIVVLDIGHVKGCVRLCSLEQNSLGFDSI